MGLKSVLRRFWYGFDPTTTRQDAPGRTNGEGAISEGGAETDRGSEAAGDAVEVAPDLVELAKAVNHIRSEMMLLRLEWAEVIDKLTAWSNRQAARDRVRAKKNLDRMNDDDDGEGIAAEAEAAAAGGTPEVPHRGSERVPELNGVPLTGRHPKADLYARARRLTP